MSAPQLPPFDHRPRAYHGPAAEDVLALRRRYLTPALVLYYQTPLMIVETLGQSRYV